LNVVQPIRDPAKVAAIEGDLAARNPRDCLLFVAGTNTALRISDLLQLRAGDVRRKAQNGADVARQYIEVKEKKTGKKRFITMTPKLKRALLEYVGGLDDRVFLFRSRQGGNRPMSRTRAYQVLREVAQRHGVEHIGTHTLRKTFGYHFYKQTGDVALLQRILNHSSPAITLRYIGIEQDQIDAAMRRFVIQE
jgi:integrase